MAPNGDPTAPNRPAPRRVPRWRRILASTLVVVGCVIAPISVMGVWIHNTLLNTNQYVATVGPLADNPAIQSAIANRVTKELTGVAELDRRLKDALPKKAAFVAPYIAQGLQQFVHELVLKIVESSHFSTLWKTLNRRAHAQVVAVLRGQTKGVFLKNGQVVLDLGPVVKTVTGQLDKLGISGLQEKASGINNRLVLFSSNDLKKAQLGVRLLDDLAVVLPILTGLAFVGGIALSGHRRRTILHSALGLALAMGLMLLVFDLLRTIYLNALPAGVDLAAAKAVYNQLLSFLRLSVRTLFVFGIVVAIAAWLAGPGRVATAIRARSVQLVRKTPGPSFVAPEVSAVVARYRTPARVLAVGVGLLVLILLNAPGPWAVIVIALCVLLLLAVIEVVARGAPTGEETPSGVAATTAAEPPTGPPTQAAARPATAAKRPTKRAATRAAKRPAKRPAPRTAKAAPTRAKKPAAKRSAKQPARRPAKRPAARSSR